LNLDRPFLLELLDQRGLTALARGPLVFKLFHKLFAVLVPRQPHSFELVDELILEFFYAVEQSADLKFLGLDLAAQVLVPARLAP